MTIAATPLAGLDPHELSMLARVLESFTETLDLEEVLHRVVKVALEEFDTDRSWILDPGEPSLEWADVVWEETRTGCEGAMKRGERIPLESSREFVRRTLASAEPLEATAETPGLDPEVLERFGIRSQLVQVLTTRDGHRWVFGLHQCDRVRRWTDREKRLFAALGRYAALAINNAMLHRRAVSEAGTTNAILDQIPEAAAIFGPDGRLLRMNAAATSQRPYLFAEDAEKRLTANHHRDLDGRSLAIDELPSMRALRGESVNGDYRVLDSSSGEDRVVNFRSAPVRDENGTIVGSVVLSRDVTEDRLLAEQERWRRRRAETLGGLSLDLVTLSSDFSNLDQIARRVGEGMQVNVAIHIYRSATDLLELAGSFALTPASAAQHAHAIENPYRSGEGIPGTVFQIGQPLLFADPKAGSLTGYARTDHERRLMNASAEQSLIACPIEAYGARIGALVVGHVDRRRSFKAEDLAFAQSVAERIAAASHIYRLARLSGDGHRAAEDLARREVSARAGLEAVLESAPIGIAVVSADELRFEIANGGWMEFAQRNGKVREDTDLTGLRVVEVIPRLEAILAEAAEKNEMRIDKAIPLVHDGQTYYYDRIISPVRGRLSGTTQSVTLLVQDVTEAVKAKQEIEALVRMMEERTARLDSILGSMTDALWVFDAGGKVIDVNRAALSMFGLASQSDAIARGSFEDFLLRYPDGRAIPAEEFPYARALRGEIVPDFVAVGAHLITGRDIDLSIAAAPIRSGGAVVGAVLVIRDISALQEFDRKKDEFLSVASHELRTPLTTIRGYAQLLTQLVADIGPEERATYLRSMLGEIDRMMGLISELLDVSRIQRNRLQVNPQEMDWVEFVRRLIDSQTVQHPDRKIEFGAATDSILIHADPHRMRQVIDNLLSNAIKYSPEGSPVVVRVEAGGGRVRTSVTDRGIGIPADELSHLFERFHRARNVSSRYYGGLGLGLYISRAIVEAHEGSISVDTREGEGSTFSIDLPLESAQTSR
ncbi:MAG TPA: ATP-binding protein [Thermoanaerobaculia bacterium]|nr:ATP-binding protein [Thermoanaerobaculia bacterium]